MAAPDLMPGDVELRCQGGLHGIVRWGNFIEVKCRHWPCNAKGKSTFHTIDLTTGRVVKTESFQEPFKEQ